MQEAGTRGCFWAEGERDPDEEGNNSNSMRWTCRLQQLRLRALSAQPVTSKRCAHSGNLSPSCVGHRKVGRFGL